MNKIYPYLIGVLLAFVSAPHILHGQVEDEVMNRYIYDMSLLEKVFGFAASTEFVMTVSVVFLMLFMGIGYIAFGVIVFFLFRD